MSSVTGSTNIPSGSRLGSERWRESLRWRQGERKGESRGERKGREAMRKGRCKEIECSLTQVLAYSSACLLSNQVVKVFEEESESTGG